jgi:hypothetical protein
MSLVLRRSMCGSILGWLVDNPRVGLARVKDEERKKFQTEELPAAPRWICAAQECRGDYTLFRPAVQILTPMHPLSAQLHVANRNTESD